MYHKSFPVNFSLYEHVAKRHFVKVMMDSNSGSGPGIHTYICDLIMENRL